MSDLINKTFHEIALPGHFSARHEIRRKDVTPRIKKPPNYVRDRTIKQFADSKDILHTACGPDFVTVISNSAEAQTRHTLFIQQIREEIAPPNTNKTRLLVGNCSAVNKTQLAGLLSDYGTLESLDMSNSLNTSAEYGEGAFATLLRSHDAKAIPRQISITALGCQWDVNVSIARSFPTAAHLQEQKRGELKAPVATQRCRDFSRGQCTRSKCKFQHNTERDEPKRIVCRDYNRSVCFRPACRFAHVQIHAQPDPRHAGGC